MITNESREKLYYRDIELRAMVKQEIEACTGLNFNIMDEHVIELKNGDKHLGAIIVRMSITDDGVNLWVRLNRNSMNDIEFFAHMLKAHQGLPETAQRLLVSGNSILMSWAKLNIEPVVEIVKLFKTFSGNDRVIETLAKQELIFTPPPYSESGSREFWYVPESKMNQVLDAWRVQLLNHTLRK